MGINLQTEDLLGLTDATKALPLIDGKRPHISTLWRWCRKGVRGVRLEHVRLGHRVCTSREALSRFAQRLADVDSVPIERKPETTRKPRSDAERQRAIARAEAELRAEGF